MADKIVVLQSGVVEQTGSPLELYNRPANLFVAGFIGSPKMNFFKGKAAAEWNAATVGVRPEHLTAARDHGKWQGTVSVAEHVGSDTFLYVTSDGLGDVTVRAPGEFSAKPGQAIFITPEPDHVHRFDKDGKALRQ